MSAEAVFVFNGWRGGAGASAIVLTRNMVYSALYMVIIFLATALIYLLYQAPLIAMLQITVYAGGIMVLYLFVIMLISAEKMSREENLPWQRPLAFGLMAALLAETGYLATQQWKLPSAAITEADFGSPGAVGLLLYNRYLLPFEVISILLLVALIGAVATLAALLRFPEGGQILLWQWLKIGALEIPIALKVDALASVMILVVTAVGTLIHATMVTAGVYMIARSQALYNLAPLTQSIVAWIGGATALFAATIAVAQWDIKKVMAYSTISQLGYMIAAVGMGAYAAGIFHLVTHAFFKALLFLSAGSVMHGTNNEGDMRNLGGLRRAMATTFKVFVIGGFGLAGVPIFARFWSKDAILGEAFVKNPGMFALLLAAAGVTSFYVFRQLYLVFGGERRIGSSERSQAYHPHESPRVMTWPLVALAALVTLGGLLNAPPQGLLTRFLGGVAAPFEFNIAAASVGLAALGWLGAWALYGRRPHVFGQADPLQGLLGPAYVLSQRKYFVDELYGAFFVRPYQHFSRFLAETIDWRFLHDFVHETLIARVYTALVGWMAEPFDRGFIDQGIERMGTSVRLLSGWVRPMQSGYVRRYVVWFGLGVVAILGYLLLRMS